MEKHLSTVTFKFKSPALQLEREPLCWQVLRNFKNIPVYKLLCYVDDEFPSSLPAIGNLPAGERSFSGLHAPTRGGGRWPDHVQKWILTPDYEFAFDNLIYIPETKYASDQVAFSMILAHEFQHFVQYGESNTAWRVDDILLRSIGKFDQRVKTWDIPSERDAMIVSKGVIEAEFGTSAVRQLMETQMGGVNNQNEVWAFLNNLSSTTAYDWREETCRMIEMYRSQLQDGIAPEEIGILNDWIHCNRMLQRKTKWNS